MNERKDKVLVLIPLNLDGYLLSKWTSGKASQVRERLAADLPWLETEPLQVEEQVENVIRALRADDSVREPSPRSKL